VHEAWIKLSGLDVTQIREHGHFLALAGTAMRRILVNHAEARNARKRGGDRGRVTLFEGRERVRGTRPTTSSSSTGR
jgi:hypothetical protein